MKMCQECMIKSLRVRSTDTGQILIVKELVLHKCLVTGGRTPPRPDAPRSHECFIFSVI